MNKLSFLFLLLIFLCPISFSQGKIAIGLVGGVNTGLNDFSDKYGSGYGATATFFYSVIPSTDITLSVGYNRLSKDKLSFTTIPLMTGFRFYLPVIGIRLYLPGFLGLHLTTNEAELPSAVVNGNVIGGNRIFLSDNFFWFGTGVGVLIKAGPIINLDFNIHLIPYQHWRPLQIIWLCTVGCTSVYRNHLEKNI